MNTIKDGFKFILSEIFVKPKESKNASTFVVKMVWFLRIAIFLMGFVQIFRGEAYLGILIIISVLFIVTPSFFTRSSITDIPLEIEFFLFIIVFFQFIVGEAQGFYGKLPFYDNLTHFFFPFLVSVIGFTSAYSLYVSGRLKVSIRMMIFIMIVFTLGIGAFWELLEFSSDQFLLPHINDWHRFQGSNEKTANFDTMTDLSADFLGGIVGSIVASRYLIERKYKKRIRELFMEITRGFFRRRKAKKSR